MNTLRTTRISRPLLSVTPTCLHINFIVRKKGSPNSLDCADCTVTATVTTSRPSYQRSPSELQTGIILAFKHQVPRNSLQSEHCDDSTTHINQNNISKEAEEPCHDVLPAQVSHMQTRYQKWKLTESQLASSSLYPHKCLPDFHLPLLHLDLLPESPLCLLFLPPTHSLCLLMSLE